MSGVRLRERGCESLQLLPGMPIRHRRIEEKDQSSEETGGFSSCRPTGATKQRRETRVPCQLARTLFYP